MIPLQLSLIHETGFSGDFLSTEHTFEHFRTELRTSGLLNRTRRQQWTNEGKQGFEDNAKRRLSEIRRMKRPEYVNPAQLDSLCKLETSWLKGLEK